MIKNHTKQQWTPHPCMDDRPLAEQHHQQQLTLPCSCFCKPATVVQEEPKQIAEPNWLSGFEGSKL